MKRKIILLAFCIALALTLCSFTSQKHENENVCLQNAYQNTKNSAAELNICSSKTETYDAENNADSYFFGEFGDELEGIYESFLSALPDGAPKSLEEISGAIGIKEAFQWLLSAVTSEKNVKALALFLAIGILLSISEAFAAELGDTAPVTRSAVAIALSLPVLTMMRELVFEVYDGIYESSALFSGMLPVLCAILAVGSGGAAAAASSATMSASLGFVTNVLSENLFPLSAMTFSLSMVSALDTGGITDGAVKGIRGIFNFLIGLSSLLIVGILGAQTLIAVSADNLAIKSAKYALSGMIPVVGGMVSGALTTLIAGVRLLSSTVGAVSVIALFSVVGVPLVRLLFFRFCLFLCITVSSFSGGGFGARLFTSMRGALDTLIAVFASSTLIYALEIIIVTASVRGAM